MIPSENRPISIHPSRGVSEWPVVSSIFFIFIFTLILIFWGVADFLWILII